LDQFQGGVYQGGVGDYSHPLAGASVVLRCSNTVDDPGVICAQTETDEYGLYSLIAPAGYSYFNIEKVNPVNFYSVGASSVGGVVVSSNQIQYSSPLYSTDRNPNAYGIINTKPHNHPFKYTIPNKNQHSFPFTNPDNDTKPYSYYYFFTVTINHFFTLSILYLLAIPISHHFSVSIPHQHRHPLADSLPRSNFQPDTNRDVFFHDHDYPF
jgi:hypothetical protein